MSGQKQSAGEGSNQIQVSGDLVFNRGVTEERAVEIAREQAREALSSYSDEARMVGDARIDDFLDRLLPILQADGRMGALGDPAIQTALRKAQLGAAGTDDSTEHDVLAELITARIDTAGDRQSTAGIERAIEVVDKLDPAALGGLTVFVAVTMYRTIGAELHTALRTQEALFAQFTEFELPTGIEWIDHLDVLDMVRPSRGGSKLKPASECFPDARPGFVSVGISNDDPDLTSAAARLAELGFPDPPIPHELKSDHMRLPITRLDSFRFAGYGLDPEAVVEASEIAKRVFKVEDVDVDLRAPFMEKWREFPTLSKIADWWDQIPEHFAVTTVGKVLQDANLRRLNRLPIADLSDPASNRS